MSGKATPGVVQGLLTILCRGIAWCLLGLLLGFIALMGLSVFLGTQVAGGHLLTLLQGSAEQVLQAVQLPLLGGSHALVTYLTTTPVTTLHFLQGRLASLAPWWVVVQLSGRVLLCRLLLLQPILLTLFIAGGVGVVDGLVSRAIRRRTGGLESALIYAKSMALAKTIVIVTLLVWLTVPWVLPLNGVQVLSSLCFFLAVQRATTYFKKYL